MRETVEVAARIVELMAVAVILVSVLHGTVRYLIHWRGARTDAFDRYKIYVGKGMLLGLEFLVAADIVETVTLERTLESVGLLALLVVVRTFLSWSLVVEIEGRWPWEPSSGEGSGATSAGSWPTLAREAPRPTASRVPE